ncbi:MAG TPA: FtsH protease activity modulator HflK [Gammaproteobacteria bacterium]|nr:FtsH protease activity modulator HflK [Gammaproteobacteria bacterium]
MGWNETPGGGKGKDPWGNRGNGEGPPDLDEIVRKMQQGIGGIFGGRSSGSGSNGSSFVWLLIVLAFVIWLVIDMAHIIDEQERGIVLRFGEYQTTLQPGLKFRFPRPIERVLIVNVGRVRSVTHNATMLTQDENIVDVELAVQWRIKDPQAYRFNVYGPDATLHQATESAVREVIGKSELDFVLTEGRSQLAQSQQRLIQQIMDDYNTGILILGVETQPAKPPEQVKAAFDDAIKAREDEQRLVNEAEAYRNDIIPKARGGAARLREEANAYKAGVIAKAEGEANRFEKLLTEYERAPAVTRERLYIDAIESVLSNTSKVLLDTEGNNNLMYIPIDRILEDARAGKNKNQSSSANSGEYKPKEPSGSGSGSGVTPYSDRTRGTR